MLDPDKYPDWVERAPDERILERMRAFPEIQWEEAKAFARRFGKDLPYDWASATTESMAAHLKALKELADTLLDKQPKRRNVPAFLYLIVKRFAQAPAPPLEVVISYEDIIKECHDGGGVDDDSIRRATIYEAKKRIHKTILPFRIKVRGRTAVITRFG
jgi:hypothetical protein